MGKNRNAGILCIAECGMRIAESRIQGGKNMICNFDDLVRNRFTGDPWIRSGRGIGVLCF